MCHYFDLPPCGIQPNEIISSGVGAADGWVGLTALMDRIIDGCSSDNVVLKLKTVAE